MSGKPGQCTCTSAVVATFAETLTWAVPLVAPARRRLGPHPLVGAMSFSGPQHWAEADLILAGDADPCSYGCPHTGCPHEMSMLIRAIGHGLLALAAATMSGLTPADRHEWLKAADPEYAAEQDAEVSR